MKAFFQPLICVLLFCFISLSFARSGPPVTSPTPPEFVAFDQQIKQYVRRYQVPGAALAVMQNGKLIYTQGYGWADTDNKKPVQATNLFRIASVSKVITATAVLQLIQEGKLHYDDKLLDVLDDIQPLPAMKLNPQLRNLTVRDLLWMAAGWGNSHVMGYDPTFGPLPDLWQKRYGLTPPLSCYQAARFMMGMPLQYRAGTHFAYANIEYCYLGLLVSKANNLPYTPEAYEHYIQQHVLAPLGITDMRLGSSQQTLPNEVHYYADDSDLGLPYGNLKVLQKTYSFGGWLASPIDLAKFASGLPKILNKTQLAFITTQPKGIEYPVSKKDHKIYFYSSGWWLSGSPHGLVWVAHGSFTGTRAMIIKRPDGTTIAIIFNRLPKPSGSALARLHVLLENIEC